MLMSYSKHAVLQEQWPEGAKAVTEVTKRPKSAGTTFKESMIALVENLRTKDPFYVRCIKPNETKSPMRFDDERCLHQVSGGARGVAWCKRKRVWLLSLQVNYLGLLENVRVRRAGFANRQPYQRFVQRWVWQHNHVSYGPSH